MTIYQNKWAGHETYFVRVKTSGRLMHGIKLCNFNGKWLFDMDACYFTSSLKEAPERWPVVGNISEDDLTNAILSHITKEEEQRHD